MAKQDDTSHVALLGNFAYVITLRYLSLLFNTIETRRKRRRNRRRMHTTRRRYDEEDVIVSRCK